MKSVVYAMGSLHSGSDVANPRFKRRAKRIAFLLCKNDTPGAVMSGTVVTFPSALNNPNLQTRTRTRHNAMQALQEHKKTKE